MFIRYGRLIATVAPVLIAAIGLMACTEDKPVIEGDRPEKSAFHGQDHDQDSTSKNRELHRQTLSEAQFVGAAQCGSCHAQATSEWRESHHDLAMQEANNQTVLGDFDNADFDYFGTVSKFYKKGDGYFVKTDGADGKLTEFPIAYTFGVYPLQQYLIAFPGGRLQALNIVWDSRPKEQGGQRWYHLYPDEHIKHDDELHWTGINQNWNYMCADCHSTNLEKKFDAVTGSFNTTWTDMDVSCEACHGPGSEHLRWASSKNPGYVNETVNKGLTVVLDERNDMSWVMNANTGIAERSREKLEDKEIETCAACHSRRGSAFSNAKAGDPFLDNFHVSLLTDPEYYPDGQINGEVYVYGSFLQSKMYHAGVTCTDCHQPHSLKLRAEGNQLCGQCHLPAKYDTTTHHLHVEETAGSQCINCHMPTKTYMGVDVRHDHSFRIPRPDLSETLGVPNACVQCHVDKNNAWAANKIGEVHGTPDPEHYAVALAFGRQQLPQAGPLLAKLIADEMQPAIVRATAVTLFSPYITNETAAILRRVASREEPLMTLALATVADEISPQYRPVFSVPLLYDDSRVTRSLAANSLSGISLQTLPQQVHSRYKSAISAFIESSEFNADRPESLTNLGDYYSRVNAPELARTKFKNALQIAPYYTPAYVNFADFYRRQGDENGVQRVLTQALGRVQNKAIILHGLGLSYIRLQKLGTALDYLRQASEAPDATARFSYVYAIALNSGGQPEKAVTVLEQALTSYGDDREILSALISIYTDLGDSAKAGQYRQRLM